jgi:hypothetical protein
MQKRSGTSHAKARLNLAMQRRLLARTQQKEERARRWVTAWDAAIGEGHVKGFDLTRSIRLRAPKAFKWHHGLIALNCRYGVAGGKRPVRSRSAPPRSTDIGRVAAPVALSHRLERPLQVVMTHSTAGAISIVDRPRWNATGHEARVAFIVARYLRAHGPTDCSRRRSRIANGY